MASSTLVDLEHLSPNHSGMRTEKITRITPHCIVGQATISRIGDMFDSSSWQASCNYGIGTDGRVVEVVPEDMRSWCSSSSDNDQRAVTIECASDNYAPYRINNTVYSKLIDLCVDICKRNGKRRLNWLGDIGSTLEYEKTMGADEMVITVHRWFANKSCPGEWLMNKMGDLCNEVNAHLSSDEGVKPDPGEEQEVKRYYCVQVGAFKYRENAERLLASLESQGYACYITIKERS